MWVLDKESITVVTAVGCAVATGHWWVAFVAVAMSINYFVLLPAERLAEFERELYEDMKVCTCKGRKRGSI